MRWIIASLLSAMGFVSTPDGDVHAQESLRIETDTLTLVGQPEPQALRVSAPSLTLAGPAEPLTVKVETPGLTLAGPPAPADLRIEAPPLTLAGPTEPVVLRVEAPALSLVTAQTLRREVPTLTLVGPLERDGVGEPGGTPTAGPPAGVGGSTGGGSARVWCSGDYSVLLGQPRLSNGMAMGRPETTSAQISTSACTAQMRVIVEGRGVDLVRQADGAYLGSVQGGEGQTLTYSLTCHADLSVTGNLQARDANITVSRDLTLTRAGDQPAPLIGCGPEAGYAPPQ